MRIELFWATNKLRKCRKVHKQYFYNKGSNIRQCRVNLNLNISQKLQSAFILHILVFQKLRFLPLFTSQIVTLRCRLKKSLNVRSGDLFGLKMLSLLALSY